MSNKKTVLIVGKSAAGKTASLRNIKQPEGVIYLKCDSGKDLPFQAKFRQLTITDPFQIYDVFLKAEQSKKVHTIIIDTATFMMDMFESNVVLKASNTMQAWSDYAQFFKRLMQDCVANSTKTVIMTAHTMDILNENDGVMETLVKVKGSLMNQGIESYFSTVVACKKMSLVKLKDFSNPHLIVTDDEKDQGFKYVFQTRLTKETVNERIRGPMGLWSKAETFIDNDAQFLIDQLNKFYK